MGTEKQIASEEQAQFWRMVFETHRGSGLTIKQFCKNEGISEAAFYAWRKKLAAASGASSLPGAAASGAFVEVALRDGPPAALELMFTSGHRLRISPGVDGALLERVLSTLKRAGLC